jgi:nucleoside 2-deoxyribosyltransferase
MVSDLARLLHQRGHRVLTTHLLSVNVQAEDALKGADFVFQRDMKWLEECDVVIAEVSGASLGVGFEIGYTLGKGKKKVYVLYHKDVEKKISFMASGNNLKNCIRVPYSSMEDIYKFVNENL